MGSNKTPIIQQSGHCFVVSNFTIGTCTLGNIDVTLDRLTLTVCLHFLPPPSSHRAGKSGGVFSVGQKMASASFTTTKSRAIQTSTSRLASSSWKNAERYSQSRVIPNPAVSLPWISPTGQSTCTPRKSESYLCATVPVFFVVEIGLRLYENVH